MSSRIYTRTGDDGTTSLVDGTRVPKDSRRIEAYGTVDEANSWVGAARAFVDDEPLDRALEFLQHRLYNCSSNLATPPGTDATPVGVGQDDVDQLERMINGFEEKSGAIACFVLPAGGKDAAMLHVARTVCRRAERRVRTLQRDEEVDPLVLAFINRASDMLFAAARYSLAIVGESDVAWDAELPVPD